MFLGNEQSDYFHRIRFYFLKLLPSIIELDGLSSINRHRIFLFLSVIGLVIVLSVLDPLSLSYDDHVENLRNHHCLSELGEKKRAHIIIKIEIWNSHIIASVFLRL